MQVVIEIPKESIPQNQEILIVDLHFIDGQICECNYPFQELPKNHGRLIDADDFIDVCEILADKTCDKRVFEQAEWIARDMRTILDVEE